MKRLIFFLLFELLFGGLITIHAQPGLSRPRVYFKVYKPDGQIVTRQDTQIKIIPLWDEEAIDVSDLAQGCVLYDQVDWKDDSTLKYRINLIGSRVFPPGLKIRIEAGPDTMEVLDIARHKFKRGVLDSIPILHGTYDVPEYYRHIKKKKLTCH